MSVLADTSIWVDYFRGREPAAAQLEQLVRRREVAVCGPVLAELLAGARTDEDAARLLDLVGLHWVEIGRQTWRRAGDVARSLRLLGHTLPLLDALIAVACAEAHVPLWTRDQHVAKLREALPELDLYAPA